MDDDCYYDGGMFWTLSTLAWSSFRENLDEDPSRRTRILKRRNEKSYGRYVENHARRIYLDIFHGDDSRLPHRDTPDILRSTYCLPRMDLIHTPIYNINYSLG